MINVAICDDMPHVCDGYKSFIDIEDDIVEINSSKENKKIERNGNPFRRGPRK